MGLRESVTTRCGWLLLAMAVVATAGTRAQTLQRNLGVTAVIPTNAKLELSTGSIGFPYYDPDDKQELVASDVTIRVWARSSPGSQIRVTVYAQYELESGSDKIPLSNLSWTGGGTGFQNCDAMSKGTDVTVALFDHSGIYEGTQTYKLANSWGYAPGSYSTTLVYTLTAL